MRKLADHEDAAAHCAHDDGMTTITFGNTEQRYPRKAYTQPLRDGSLW